MTRLRNSIAELDLKRTSAFPPMPVAGPVPAATNQRLLNWAENLLATRGASSDQFEQQQPATECQRPAPRPPPRVLLIDDDPEYIRALQIRLESRGITALPATTGFDGFCSAVGEPADAILLDYQLPNGRGDFILGQLKTNLATRGIPVIVISGSKDRALEYTLVNSGAVRYMRKPLDFEELMSELRKLLAS